MHEKRFIDGARISVYQRLKDAEGMGSSSGAISWLFK